MAEPDPQTQAMYTAKVIEQLQQISGYMDSLRAVQANRAGLPVAAFNLLSCVAGFGEEGCTVSQAAARLGVRPQALNTPAARLAEDELLSRQVDQADSRARRLVATASGNERMRAGRKILEDLAAIIAEQVPAANVAHLILSRLLSGMQTIADANAGPEKDL